MILLVWSMGSFTLFPPPGGASFFSINVYLRAALFSLFFIGRVCPGCRLRRFSMFLATADNALFGNLQNIKISKHAFCSPPSRVSYGFFFSPRSSGIEII